MWKCNVLLKLLIFIRSAKPRHIKLYNKQINKYKWQIREQWPKVPAAMFFSYCVFKIIFAGFYFTFLSFPVNCCSLPYSGPPIPFPLTHTASASYDIQLWFWRNPLEYICSGWKPLSVPSPNRRVDVNIGGAINWRCCHLPWQIRKRTIYTYEAPFLNWNTTTSYCMYEPHLDLFFFNLWFLETRLHENSTADILNVQGCNMFWWSGQAVLFYVKNSCKQIN